ncbi:MAG: amino acid permease [Acidobacteriota bacterium]|nr:amino acid permease [Acidobacteriota bacterium]
MTPSSPVAAQPTAFVKGLGLTSATTLVMGSMIGSGIFIVSSDVARQVKSPGLLILCWLIGAALTVVAALSYGELAAAMPHAGGQYVYLREAFGRLWGFLYGWTLFTVIQTGTIAAVAVAFAKYSGVFLPSISARNYLLGSGKLGLTTQQLLAIAIVILLTFVNTRGVRTGALVQNVFTFAKVASLLALVGLGFLLGRNPSAIAANFHNFWGVQGGAPAPWSCATVALVGTAMVGPLFSSDAWNNVTFTAGEVRNPKRNLPLSLGFGVGLVSLLYIGCNFVYLAVLTLPQIQTAPEDRVATAVVSAMFGPVATRLMAAAIMISTFGCCNGMIMSGARVYYTMAQDNLFFRRAGTLDPVHRTPVFALAIQCVWTVLLTLSGQYNDLLDYVIFAVLLFYILTIGGLFRLRRTRPDLPRPYRAAGYPVLPALYILTAGVIEIFLLLNKTALSVRGLVLVLLGVPVYSFWRGRNVPSKGEPAL